MSLDKIWGWVHWGIRSKFRNEWHDIINEIDDIGEPIDCPVIVEYRFYFIHSRSIDSDNCSVMSKAILDALKNRGMIKDDSNRYVRSSILTPVFTTDKEKKVMRQENPTDFVEIFIYKS